MRKISKSYYTVGSLAKLTSTTERTLRFYDRKGLLKPSGYNEQGHRIYTDEDLVRLHQILTLKYLGYSLDEIGKYLAEQNSKDFHASLELQHELLLQKQQHIQHVVSTMERVRAVIKDNDTIDHGLIMTMIHSIQHEEDQKQWLSDRLPDALVQSIFMSGSTMEEQLQATREMTIGLNDLLVMYKQGLQPGHPLVQERALRLQLIIKRLLGHQLHELGTGEVGSVLKEMDPQLFPSSFEPDFKNYLREVFYI
ncbi:MerR family transcriptional regulator [Paenibacillus pinihumi]|uniref:MerR family transcriptional regulator n=1 Tax=Paenibacillus pinihumi TaxID=669462 RepID=UPI00042989D3|nr:MerR family transcriptional regulator [Paenibacillus pinihumi]